MHGLPTATKGAALASGLGAIVLGAGIALVLPDWLRSYALALLAWRDDRRVARLLKAAQLKVSSACIEDINWRASRSLDRSLIAALAGGDWLRHARNLLITGATEYAT